MTEPMNDLLTLSQLEAAPILSRGFYQRPTVEVAEGLLGALLVRRDAGGVVAVRITEVEAYLGIADPACHTFGGRRTRRNASMWGPAGHAYVYRIYGLHCCLNIVTVGVGTPEAVLIRGATTVHGGRLVGERRGRSIARRAWTDGPGKLCQALAIGLSDDGADLYSQDGALTLRRDDGGTEVGEVERLPRVGVDYAREAAGWPLRLRVR
jgi:DNA-3-methyladenine glycosylase